MFRLDTFNQSRRKRLPGGQLAFQFLRLIEPKPSSLNDLLIILPHPPYFFDLPPCLNVRSLVHKQVVGIHTTLPRNELLCQLFGGQWISHKKNIRHPGQLKKLKSWGPFWSYQLNSTANLARLPRNRAEWAELAVLFSW